MTIAPVEGDGAEGGALPGAAGAHQPEIDVTTRGVAPDDVKGRVDVVVTQARYLPRRVDAPLQQAPYRDRGESMYAISI